MIIIERFNGIQRFDIADVLFDRSTENNIMTHVPLRIFFQMGNCYFAITSSNMVIDIDCYRGDNIYSTHEKFLQLVAMKSTHVIKDSHLWKHYKDRPIEYSHFQ